MMAGNISPAEGFGICTNEQITGNMKKLR